MACRNDREESGMEPAVYHSRGEDVKNSQQSAGPKDTGNIIDALVERLTEQARALKL